jgi:hypothetical protein
VAHGDDEVVASEHVQFAELDALLGVEVLRGPEHHEQGLAVALHLGALVGVHGILDREVVQPELGGELVELLL